MNVFQVILYYPFVGNFFFCEQTVKIILYHFRAGGEKRIFGGTLLSKSLAIALIKGLRSSLKTAVCLSFAFICSLKVWLLSTRFVLKISNLWFVKIHLLFWESGILCLLVQSFPRAPAIARNTSGMQFWNGAQPCTRILHIVFS